MEKNKKNFNDRRWKLDEIPNTVMIETVIGCNLRCEMCPVPNSTILMNGRQTTTMSSNTFLKILEEISDKPRKLHLNQMGEPLLNKSIDQFVALSKKAGHFVSLTTNGTLMDGDISRKLILAGIDHVTFSIDGYEEKTYESIRIGANYNKVRSNIEYYSRLRNELKKKTTIQIDCILSELTKNEINTMYNYWKNKVDIFNVIPLDDWSGKHKLPNRFGLRNSVTEGQQYNKRYPCDLLWTSIAISAEGYLMYCCHDYKLLSNLPNVNENPLKEIWKTNLSEERRKHIKEEIDSDPCLHCDAWKTRRSYFYKSSEFLTEIGTILPPKFRFRAKKLFQKITRSFTGCS